MTFKNLKLLALPLAYRPQRSEDGTHCGRFILILIISLSLLFPLKQARAEFGFFFIPLAVGIMYSSLMGGIAACEVEKCYVSKKTGSTPRVRVSFRNSAQVSLSKPLDTSPSSDSASWLALQSSLAASQNTYLEVEDYTTNDIYNVQLTGTPPPLPEDSKYKGAGEMIHINPNKILDGGVSSFSSSAYAYNSLEGHARQVLSDYNERVKPEYRVTSYSMTNTDYRCRSGFHYHDLVQTGDTVYIDDVTFFCVYMSADRIKDGKKNLIFDIDKKGWVADRLDIDWDEEEIKSVNEGASSLRFMGKNDQGETVALVLTRSGNRVKIRQISSLNRSDAKGVNDKALEISATTGKVSSVSSIFSTDSDLSSYNGYFNNLPFDGSGSGSSEFPDDYATSSDVASAINRIDDVLKSVEDLKSNSTDSNLSGTQEVGDPSLSNFQFSDSFFKEDFNNLLGWSVPPHSSSCPTSSFEAFDRVFVIDQHCRLVDDNFGALNNVMFVVYFIFALFIVLKA